MNQKTKIYLPVIIALSLIVGLYAGNRLTKPGKQNLSGLTFPRTNKLDAIIGLISSSYVDSIPATKLVDEAIPALLKHLDPHTAYISAKEMPSITEDMQGNFGGIGVQFSIYKDTVQVVDVISGGPSSKLGIQPGDRIVQVNDSIIAGISVKDSTVMHLLRGKKGTQVKVGIKRKGINDLIQFDITRGDIPIVSVNVSYMIGKHTGYIKVNRFAETTYNEFMTAVKKLDNEGAQKFIVDLRGNPGGFLPIVIRMANEFLPKDRLILYTQGHSSPKEIYKANGKGTLQNKGVYVLIDEYSASASEIFSGAMQDNDRGVIIGRRSFGKGLVQEQIPFRDGSALRLTIARYYTPSGRCIQRSYSDGTDEYYENIMKRAAHGEFENADSIHFADSLKYKTIGGRTVYGGGGIMPDYFVPLDTTGYSSYYSKLTQKLLIYHFAFDYTDKNRQQLEKLKTATDIETYLDQQHIMDQFIRYAATKGVPRDPKGLKKSGKIIQTQVEAYVARNVIGDDGFYPIIREIDTTLKKALEISHYKHPLKKALAVTK